jgi:tetratricopeptide (TPR) repeat protein
MTTPPLLHSAQVRLAGHYVNKLRQAERATRRGRENRARWLNLIHQDWEQIKQWQAWSASSTVQDVEKAYLCSAFSIATTDVLRARQTPSETLVWVQQSLQAAQTLNDSEAELILLYQLSLAHLNLESLDQADRSAHQLMERAQAVGDELNVGRAWYLLGSTHLLRGMYAAAEEYLNKSIEILVAQHAAAETARVWRGFGRIALYRGDYHEAYEYHIRYFNIVAASGDIREPGAAHIALCGVLIFLRDFKAAEDYASRALEIARSNGFPRMIPPALLSLAEAEKDLGKLGSARLHYEEGIAAARSISPPSTIVNGLYGLGQVHFLQGDTDKALERFEEALEIALEARLLFRICEVAQDAVMLHLARSEFDMARARLYELVSSAKQLNTPHFMAKALGATVILWHRLGKHQQAAVWAGTLTTYVHLLNPTLFSTAVYEQLEAELGPEQYQQALDQGKGLTINSAVKAVLEQLDPLTSTEPENGQSRSGKAE